MMKLISSVVLTVVLSLSAVSSVSAQDTTAKADTTTPASEPVRFYEVVGLKGDIFFSNAEAYGAAQNAHIMPIVLVVHTLTFDK